MTDLDDFLEHAGVKGMKWGVRKDKGSVSKGPAPRPSGDASNAQKARTKAKTKGTSSLSNKEMRLLIDRMNLEKQYAQLNPSRSDKVKKLVYDALEKEGKRLIGKGLAAGSNAIIGGVTSNIQGRAAANAAARGAALANVRGITAG